MRRLLLALALLLVVPSTASAATLHVSTTGFDTGNCQFDHCATIGYAYKQAARGDAIEVEGGTYPKQTVAALGTPKLGGGLVAVRPAPGAIVKLSSFEILDGDHIEFRGFKVDGWQVNSGSDDIWIRDVDVDNGKWIINSSTNVHVLGGDLGPQCAGAGPGATSAGGAAQIKSGGLNKGEPANIEIRDYRFHDFTRCPAPGQDVHLDCLHVFSVEGLTVEHSTFERCSVYDILTAKDISGSGYGAPSHVRICNNRFLPMTPGSSGSFAAIGDNQHFDDYLICNNSFAGNSPIVRSSSTVPVYTNFRMVNNAMLSFNRLNCGQAGITWQGNVYQNVQGGTAPASCARQGNILYDVDGRPGPGSVAINAGVSAEATAEDYDGIPRPQGPAVDAGAYEFLEACVPTAPETLSVIKAFWQ